LQPAFRTKLGGVDPLADHGANPRKRGTRGRVRGLGRWGGPAGGAGRPPGPRRVVRTRPLRGRHVGGNGAPRPSRRALGAGRGRGVGRGDPPCLFTCHHRTRERHLANGKFSIIGSSTLVLIGWSGFTLGDGGFFLSFSLEPTKIREIESGWEHGSLFQ